MIDPFYVSTTTASTPEHPIGVDVYRCRKCRANVFIASSGCTPTQAQEAAERYHCRCTPFEIGTLYLGCEVIYEGKRHTVSLIDLDIGGIGLAGRDERVTIDQIKAAM